MFIWEIVPFVDLDLLLKKLGHNFEFLKQVCTNNDLQSHILKFAFKKTQVKQIAFGPSLQCNLIT
jgi:hypothetical protein